MLKAATAFAPGTVGNVGVGFDILGHTVQGVGDRVTARRTRTPGVFIRRVEGVVTRLPQDAARNTAGAAALTLWNNFGGQGGLELDIEKGIPLASGLGGSAASAVAAVVATNELLPSPVDNRVLLKCALEGERLASGAAHVDNVAPCLFGGL